MKYIKKLYVLLIFFTVSFSQNKETSGLEFVEEKTAIIETTLDLTSGIPISFDNQLLLEFDLSILQNNKYGNILVLHDEKSNFQCNLVYYHHTNPDTSFIQCNINGRSTKLVFPFAKNSLHRGKWYHLLLYLDCSSNTITFKHEEKKLTDDTNPLPKQPELNIHFGGFEKENDTPPMIIRDVKISVDNPLSSEKYLHWWKLDEINGTSALDCIGSRKSNVTMPTWNVNNHYNWKERGDITVPFDAAGSLDGHSFFFPAKNEMLEYNILTNKITKTVYSNKRPSKYVYSIQINNTVGIYYAGGGQISLYNKDKKSWSYIDDRFDDDMHFYGTTKFVDTVNNKVYSFGGYGWYTSKSILRQYNFVKMRWDTIPLQNRKQYKERMNVSLAESKLRGKYYLLGGIGNESGKQQDGFNPINDLWSFSLQSKQLTKIRDLAIPPEVKEISWASSPMWFFVDNDSVFYCLAKLKEQKIEVNDTMDVYQLYSSVLDSGMLQPIGEKLFLKNYQWLSGIYYSEATHELMLLKLHSYKDTVSAHLKILALYLPPISESNYYQLKKASASSNNILWYSLVGVLLFGVSVIALFKYRKKLKKEPVNVQIAVETTDYQTHSNNLTSAINIFGRFEVIDKHGKDISQTFSPLLKQLLIVLIIHSNHKKRPLTTQELTNIFWMDADPANAKNSRGVAIKRLREILHNVGNVEIIFENQLWYIIIMNGTRCDYFEYLTLRNSKIDIPEWRQKYASVIGRGLILPELSYEWLDPIRASILNEIEKTSEEIIINEENEDIKLQTAQALLLWDSINETAITTAIQILIKQKKTNLALELYKTFSSEYLKLMDEPFSQSFEDISHI